MSLSEPDNWSISKRDLVPDSVGKLPVRLIVTGEIRADRPAPGPNAQGDDLSRAAFKGGTEFFERPVPIGVSTGHTEISAGTIGARTTDGSSVYVLSNNHVYANRNDASIGDPVIQPGMIDGGEFPSDAIGRLARMVPIDFSGLCTNLVDAAIAYTTTDMVDSGTPADGYGVPYNQVLEPQPFLDVMKYGRTTGLTFGQVVA
jgi:hypothetical protein